MDEGELDSVRAVWSRGVGCDWWERIEGRWVWDEVRWEGEGRGYGRLRAFFRGRSDIGYLGVRYK